MKRIILIVSVLLMTACVTPKIIVADLNAVGKVTKVTKCNCGDGMFMYTISINPEEKEEIKYFTDTKYSIGEYIYFHTNIRKEEDPTIH